MVDQALGAVRMEAKKNYIQGFKVCKSIGGGTGSGIGTREKPLTAASSRCQQVRSEPHYTVSMCDRG